MEKRKTLSKQSYINAALVVIERSGIEKLSMRKISDELSVSPMAVYKHFANKEELLVYALDAFIARANVIPLENLPWKQWIEKMAQNMFSALYKERSWLPLLRSLPLGQEASVVTESVMQKLQASGFTKNEASKLYFAVLQIVIGGVCLQPEGGSIQQTPIALSLLLEGMD